VVEYPAVLELRATFIVCWSHVQ